MMYGTILVINLLTAVFQLSMGTASCDSRDKVMTSNATISTQFEEDKLNQLKEKWSALTGTSKSKEAIDLIPQNWLLPTYKHNVTFNSSEAKTEVAEKLAALIQKHQVQKRYEKQDKMSMKPMQHESAMEISFKDKVQEMKSNLTEKWKNKNSNSMSRSQEDTLNEYPGTNQTARNQLFQEWKAHYQCLQNNLDFIPKVHYIFPGETIKMDCQACLRPGGESRILWSLSTTRTRNVEKGLDPARKKTAFNSNNRIVIGDKGLSLNIYGVNKKDAGNYSCRVFKTLSTLHLLQVADINENITRVWPESSATKPQAAPEIILPNLGFKVSTKWRNWTACSRCSRVGKRFRVGVCTVEANGANTPQILRLFKDGIPCCSKLLPENVRNHPNVVSRKSEIMEAFCKEPCPKMGKYVVRNEKGEIVEEADNAKGVYSMRQKLPKMPPPIHRKIMFLKQWDTAYIQCPGNALNNIPTRWFVKDQPIFSKGDRIYITSSHTLIVEDLGLSDSNLYSCWQGSRLVGTVRLLVSQPVRLSFSQQISAISMVLIVSTFVIIFARAFCNALRRGS